jgi:hypothetical protein
MKAQAIALAGIMICASCAGELRRGPLSVPVQDLPAQRARLLGTTIVTEGCIFDTGEHGAFLAACDDATAGKITLVTDPDHQIQKMYFETLGHMGGKLEVHVTGLLVEPDSQRLGRNVIYLEIHSISASKRG